MKEEMRHTMIAVPFEVVAQTQVAVFDDKVEEMGSDPFVLHFRPIFFEVCQQIKGLVIATQQL